MSVLEKIRKEIEEIAPLDYPCDKRTPERIRDMALEIIDKYAEQEPTEDYEYEIECLQKRLDIAEYDKERLKEKIKALEQEPCDDAISRQAVLDRREILRDEQGTGYQAVKTKYIRELPSVRPQEQIPEQWQELKETIIEMRDNDGTGTQQEACKFLVNYMKVLEKQMVEPQERSDNNG